MSVRSDIPHSLKISGTVQVHGVMRYFNEDTGVLVSLLNKKKHYRIEWYRKEESVCFKYNQLS